MKAAALVAAGFLAAGMVAVTVARWPHLPAAERGRRLAERAGCFACHGPGGIRGASNPGRTDRTVPTFEGDLMMYAKSPAEVREWIRDGVTRARSGSRTWREQRDRGALRMPAFGDRLSGRQIDDLVSFVLVTAGAPEPPPGPARHGRDRAEALGCTGCHGAGGRLAPPNPGSWKGYVPSWDGPDFAGLVRDSAEFREWVERGVIRRFEANPLASYFLGRAVLRMPGFEAQLEPGDVGALWAYVAWLRSEGGAGATASNGPPNGGGSP